VRSFVQVVALSGPVGAGKTTLAVGLAKSVGAEILRTQNLLREQAAGRTREELQRLGEDLDQREGGKWVAAPVLAQLSSTHGGLPVIVDAVRTSDQLAELRKGASVRHIHLTAPDSVLQARYEQRRQSAQAFELRSFEELRANPTEAAVDSLANQADLVLDTDRFDIAAVRHRASEVIER